MTANNVTRQARNGSRQVTRRLGKLALWVCWTERQLQSGRQVTPRL
jgi:hypothetical protein